jgi:hypothetical protein
MGLVAKPFLDGPEINWVDHNGVHHPIGNGGEVKMWEYIQELEAALGYVPSPSVLKVQPEVQPKLIALTLASEWDSNKIGVFRISDIVAFTQSPGRWHIQLRGIRDTYPVTQESFHRALNAANAEEPHGKES